MNIFQKIKSGMLISGAVLIVAGLVLLFFPVTTTKMIAYIGNAALYGNRTGHRLLPL